MLKNMILLRVKTLDPHNLTFTINDIVDLSTYENIRKTLERMTNNNQIRRLIRGVYDIPRYNEKFGVYYPASIEGIANAIARSNNWNICPSGNYSLNLLGLSNQIPANYVYCSSGPYRKYDYNGITIEFKHVASKLLNNHSYKTNIVIQAIKELGNENINDRYLFNISKNYSDNEIDSMIEETKNTTKWIHREIIKLKDFQIISKTL